MGKIGAIRETIAKGFRAFSGNPIRILRRKAKARIGRVSL